MRQKISELQTDEVALSHLQTKAAAAAAYYNEDRLAQVWHDFYTEQAKLGRR